MGVYTKHNEQWIDDKIRQDMDTICDEILRSAKPICILLIGSFGRGEGSVFVDNTDVQPLKDYDILTVVEEKELLLPTAALSEVEQRVYSRLGYENPTTRNFLFSDFVITVEQTTLENLKHFAHVAVYDAKAGSKLLYGRDVRKEIPLKVEDIPMSSGGHVLFMKTIGLLGHFSSQYLQNPPTDQSRSYLIYECGKTYIEIGTALSLLGTIYTPSYEGRGNTLNEKFEEHFPYLAENSQNLHKKIDYFTHLKLFPDKNQYAEINHKDLWFETRDDLLLSIIFFTQETIKVKQNLCWDDFSSSCYAGLKKGYYGEVIQYLIKMRFGLNNHRLTSCANFCYQRYFSLKYVLDLYKEKGIFFPRALLESPILKIFSISPLLLACLNDDGSVDEQLFDKFEKELNRIYPFEIGNINAENKWDIAKESLLSAFELDKSLK